MDYLIRCSVCGNSLIITDIPTNINYIHQSDITPINSVVSYIPINNIINCVGCNRQYAISSTILPRINTQIPYNNNKI